MGQIASHPLSDKTLAVDSELPHYTTYILAMQGYRRTMEDAHAVLHDTSVHPRFAVLVFAVFDGHGGRRTADWVAELLPRLIMRRLVTRFREEAALFAQRLPPATDEALLSHLRLVAARINYLQFLRDCFAKAEQVLLHHQFDLGSTAVVALVVDSKLVVGNVGDLRCILSVDGCAKPLLFDHKPSHIGEYLRVVNAGGFVAMDRVDGVLALSRAFGDFGFKDPRQHAPGRPLCAAPEMFRVLAEPEVMMRDLSSSDEFLVLACDGVWDCFRNQDLVDTIRKQLAQGKQLQQIEATVLDRCIGMANDLTGIGFDNMTLLIVAIHPQGLLRAWYDRVSEKAAREMGLL